MFQDIVSFQVTYFRALILNNTNSDPHLQTRLCQHHPIHKQTWTRFNLEGNIHSLSNHLADLTYTGTYYISIPSRPGEKKEMEHGRGIIIIRIGTRPPCPSILRLPLGRRGQVLIPVLRDEDVVLDPHATHVPVLVQHFRVNVLRVDRVPEEVRVEVLAAEVANIGTLRQLVHFTNPVGEVFGWFSCR